jgi:hypothetical protein
MILKELLDHFEIDEELPEYLLDETFNSVFLDGDFSKQENCYKIEIKTRQNVTHQMFIKPDDDYPVIILSILPNGKQNGLKFGQNYGEEIPINEL